MPVNHYDYNDNTQLSPHFNVREFRCSCGKSHETLLASELVDKLEALYTTLNCSKIIVTSGYRCPEHDKAVGGTSSGQHTKGTAADVCCYGQDGQPISSKTVCCKAQDLGFTGIANITSSYQYTHLDVRTSGKWYGDEVHGNGTVTEDFYKYFGIPKTEAKNILKGIDVSYCQKGIDWEAAKASGLVDFVIFQAGYGREYDQVDVQFERNYSECKRLGIPCGAYWFSYAMSADEAKREAQVFLQTIKGKLFEYPVYMDLELAKQFALGKAACSEMADAFLSTMEQAGYYAGLYCSTYYLDKYLSNSVKSRYTIWCAQYASKCTYQNSYGIWQYNVAGSTEHDIIGQKSIPGIVGECDMDYCYTDYPSIIKAAGLNGFTKATQPTEPEPTPTPEPDTEESTLQQILKHVANIDEKLMK
ncbi:GH25 family lysozyme [Ruminococcus sp.]|uniref:GH25 family lysozyme n=1 Tax=Ruminococcus sp. TaxID=41978 RepID=UPI0039947BEE